MVQTTWSNPGTGGTVPTQCDPTPSAEDVSVTRDLVLAGKLLGIGVLDHVVIGSGNRYVSLNEKGLGFP